MSSETSPPTWRNHQQLNWITDLSVEVCRSRAASRTSTTSSPTPQLATSLDALELGTFGGAGAQALLDGVTGLVFSIEPLGYAPENDEEQEVAHEDVMGWIMKLAVKYRTRFIPIAGRSEHQIWERPISVLVLDGDHSYNGVLRDAISFASHVIDGGVVFIDAYGHPKKPGVKPAWDAFTNDNLRPGTWEHLGRVRYLHAWKRHLAG